jgi:hypothetical protein
LEEAEELEDFSGFGGDFVDTMIMLAEVVRKEEKQGKEEEGCTL